jgi:hypothetical protein
VSLPRSCGFGLSGPTAFTHDADIPGPNAYADSRSDDRSMPDGQVLQFVPQVNPVESGLNPHQLSASHPSAIG